MRTRLLKEFRQLLPVWGAAIFLLPGVIILNGGAAHVTEAYCLGLVLLSVASFGREFTQRTFAGLLVQPISRERLWWEKTGTAFCLMLLLAFAFAITWQAVPPPQWWSPFSTGLRFPGWTFTLCAICVALAGGLLGMLLLRQVVAAGLFTILVPYLLGVAVFVSSQGSAWGRVALETVWTAYAIIAFALARRLFLEAQDYHALGQNLAWPDLRTRRAARTRPTAAHPLRALVQKEIQSQQITFWLAAVLAVLQVLVLVSGHLLSLEPDSPLRRLLEAFSVLWLVLPFIAGCSAVSEERRLGTLESQLCLPVHRRTQFLVKLLMTLACGLMLGVVVPWLVGQFLSNAPLATASTLLFGNNLHEMLWHVADDPLAAAGTLLFGANASPRLVLVTTCLVLSALGFYASTLARTTLSALLIGAGLPIGAALGVSILALIWSLVGGGYYRWTPLLWLTGAPVWIVIDFRLCQANFCNLIPDQRTWWRNLREWVVASAGVLVVGLGLYHRPWEWVGIREAEHGPTRAILSGRSKLEAAPYRFAALLPDGRLWIGTRAFQASSRWRLSEVAGTNWDDVSLTVNNCVAVKSDGSLWEFPVLQVPVWQESPSDVTPRRIGSENDWMRVSAAVTHILALKRDGSLWGWGQNTYGQLGRPPSKLRFDQPVRIGTESNFVAIQAGVFVSQAATENGTVWRWSKVGPNTNSVSVLESPDLTSGTQSPSERIIVSWSSSGASMYSIAVRADGTMWAWSSWLAGYPAGTWVPLPVGLVTPEQSQVRARSMVQVGKDSDWQHVAMGQSGPPFAVKRDGSLWWWRFKPRQRTDEILEPTRLSRHSDWMAVSAGDGWPIACAAGGSLWQWWANDDLSWLFAPSQRPQKLANIFE